MHNGKDHGAADILIEVRNRYPFTRNLLEDIYRYSDYPFHIYVIDNGSTDETVDLHRIYSRDITIVRNHEASNWGETVQQGIGLGSNPYLVLVSNEVQLSQGWLANMISFLESHPRIAAVGPLASGSSHWQGVDRVREELVAQIPEFFTEDIHERNRILQYHFQHTGILVDAALTFFCTALSRRAVEESGLGKEAAGSDAEFCRRLRKAGYVIGLSLDTYVIHHSTEAQAADRVPTKRGLRGMVPANAVLKEADSPP